MFGESVSVMEGDSVTLNSDVTKIHEDDDILWNFAAKKSLLAEISRDVGIFFTYNGTDERFRDRLKLDNQTGSLIITNITIEHAGLYEVKISGVKLSSKTFNLSVYGEIICSSVHILVLLKEYLGFSLFDCVCDLRLINTNTNLELNVNRSMNIPLTILKCLVILMSCYL